MPARIGHGVATDKWPGVLLTSTDLLEWGKWMFGKHFLGVFSRDTIRIANVPNNALACAIVNTDSISGPGKHWVGFVLALVDRKPVMYYFDSYAGEVLDEVKAVAGDRKLFRCSLVFQGNPKRGPGPVDDASCGVWVARGLMDTMNASGCPYVRKKLLALREKASETDVLSTPERITLAAMMLDTNADPEFQRSELANYLGNIRS